MKAETSDALFLFSRRRIMKKESKKGTGPRYAREKPVECSQCFFWIERKKRCSLGGSSNCYYLMEAPPKKPSICDNCLFGKIRPCVGFCIRQLTSQGGGNQGWRKIWMQKDENSDILRSWWRGFPASRRESRRYRKAAGNVNIISPASASEPVQSLNEGGAS